MGDHGNIFAKINCDYILRDDHCDFLPKNHLATMIRPYRKINTNTSAKLIVKTKKTPTDGT